MANVRVIAAMSGGVDSAVAAGLLVEAGYDVIGVTMKMYSQTRAPHSRSCCGVDDFDDARRSAAVLGIAHYVLDFEETFRRSVIDRFADQYAAGRTPNPCVSCNNFVKLGTLRRYADSLGAQYVATGHYARIERHEDGVHLFRGTRAKDQAYALAQLSAEQLSGLLLPLGELDKQTTREHARRLGLPVHDKVESQDICFVEGADYRDIVATLRPQSAREGDVVTVAGEIVGRHAGVSGYTIGQRQGLPASGDGARYVTRIDAQSNTIVIGREKELCVGSLTANEVNLIRPERFRQARAPECFRQARVPVLAMTRYRATLEPALATVDGDSLNLQFETPQKAVSPGQLVALFDLNGEEVLGAATIDATF